MIFIRDAHLHETIRNNRGGITVRSIRFGDGSRGSDRFDRCGARAHPSRLARSPPPSVRSTDAPGRRGGTVYFFPRFFSSLLRTPPSISDNRSSPAAREKGIARIPDRIPNAAPTRRSLATDETGLLRCARLCFLVDKRIVGLGQNNIDPSERSLVLPREITKWNNECEKPGRISKRTVLRKIRLKLSILDFLRFR